MSIFDDNTKTLTIGEKVYQYAYEVDVANHPKDHLWKSGKDCRDFIHNYPRTIARTSVLGSIIEVAVWRLGQEMGELLQWDFGYENDRCVIQIRNNKNELISSY